MLQYTVQSLFKKTGQLIKWLKHARYINLCSSAGVTETTVVAYREQKYCTKCNMMLFIISRYTGPCARKIQSCALTAIIAIGYGGC